MGWRVIYYCYLALEARRMRVGSGKVDPTTTAVTSLVAQLNPIGGQPAHATTYRVIVRDNFCIVIPQDYFKH